MSQPFDIARVLPLTAEDMKTRFTEVETFGEEDDLVVVNYALYPDRADAFIQMLASYYGKEFDLHRYSPRDLRILYLEHGEAAEEHAGFHDAGEDVYVLRREPAEHRQPMWTLDTWQDPIPAESAESEEATA